MTTQIASLTGGHDLARWLRRLVTLLISLGIPSAKGDNGNNVGCDRFVALAAAFCLHSLINSRFAKLMKLVRVDKVEIVLKHTSQIGQLDSSSLKVINGCARTSIGRQSADR